MIIGDGIVLGAGGEKASIFVTGLSETDTVTATKGSKTLTGKWTQIPNPVAHGLPDGYTELEYIESTGTQRIDTGVLPVASEQRVVLDVNFITLGTYNRFFGSYNDSLRSFTGQAQGTGSGIIGAGQGSTDIHPSNFPKLTANTRYHFDFTAGNGTYNYKLNTVTATGTYGGSRANGQGMSIFAMYYSAGTMTKD